MFFKDYYKKLTYHETYYAKPVSYIFIIGNGELPNLFLKTRMFFTALILNRFKDYKIFSSFIATKQN